MRVSLVVLLFTNIIISNNCARAEDFVMKYSRESGENKRAPKLNSPTLLNTTLCKDFCKTDCVSYLTPLTKCFSPRKLFPNDPSWGENDLLDDNVTFAANDGQVTFERAFYSTNDGTCGGTAELQTLPLNECVGPFGAPRPWGSFQLSE
jgi:hypothetical protein